MVATTDLWVYNAENLCVSFFLPSYIHFSLTRGENKKKVFLGLPSEQQNKLQHTNDKMMITSAYTTGVAKRSLINDIQGAIK